MSDSEDVALAAVANIIAVAAKSLSSPPKEVLDKAQPCPRQKKYSTQEFMKDLLLNDIDDLNLEHRCDIGFQNIFRLINSGFQNILSIIALLIIKQDTKFKPAIPVS